MSKKTTNLDELKAGAPYTWGSVIKIHEIGPYAVVEADQSRLKNADEDVITFHPYVKGESLSQGWRTLEAAIAHAMAANFEGCDRAAVYFTRMIGVA